MSSIQSSLWLNKTPLNKYSPPFFALYPLCTLSTLNVLGWKWLYRYLDYVGQVLFPLRIEKWYDWIFWKFQFEFWRELHTESNGILTKVELVVNNGSSFPWPESLFAIFYFLGGSHSKLEELQCILSLYAFHRLDLCLMTYCISMSILYITYSTFQLPLMMYTRHTCI